MARHGKMAKQGISTHAPRTGSDGIKVSFAQPNKRDFNPRSPHGERLDVSELTGGSLTFQPTLPARGATSGAFAARPFPVISTHAPRTGSDSFGSPSR